MIASRDQMHRLRNFLSQPMTQSSVVGPSCVTTTSVHATSAPMSTTYYSSMNHSCHVKGEHLKDSDVNHQPSDAPLRGSAAPLNLQIAVRTQPSTSELDTRNEKNEFNLSKEEQTSCEFSESKYQANPSSVSSVDVKQTETQEYAVDVANAQSQGTLPPNLCSETKSEPLKPEKQEKAMSGKTVPAGKKHKDSDLFIKVIGKLYQRLGKIGSGGSSEVHKVISSDCTIYALKKIKLRGRDYATAFGFCQEIEYLNNLKGKTHIIQLVDYEVTDKALLHAVLSGSINNKDGRVKDDSFIYMVLEYGEIDLAHMLSQRWLKSDDRRELATILLTGGYSKLHVSGGIQVQRADRDGNTIKCGQPSDIWSLGCILYQMVYGRTPFADYKTFWARFLVITDSSHQIVYEPVSNPWLLDLVKKCLAWDRNERWRIPQLLQHPFLVPLVVPTQPSSHEQSCKLQRIIDENCWGGSEAAKLLYELKQLLEDPAAATMSQILTLRQQQCTLLSQVSRILPPTSGTVSE